jgi:hypothetical protein
MSDLWHQWGNDLVLGVTGDLSLASGSDLGQQRLLRRLLTNLQDYLWQLDYGAGLGRFIGQPGSALQIKAVIRGQMFKEPIVARTPEPVIDVQVSPVGSVGTIYVVIRYSEAPSGKVQVLSFSLGA